MSSSFVFVIVIAIWVVYLALHVVRRREHLATARNVDRFSEHMKVLQRRAVRNAPRTQLKSSINLVRGRDTICVLADQVEPSVASIALPPEATSQPAQASSPEFEPVEPLVPSHAQPAASAINLTWPFALLGDLTAARALRAATLVLSVVFASLVGVFVMVGMLPWWALTVAITGLGVVLVWLPRAARAERVARERRMRTRVQPSAPVARSAATDSLDDLATGHEQAAAYGAAARYDTRTADEEMAGEIGLDEDESLARRTSARVAAARRASGRVSASTRADREGLAGDQGVDDIEFVDAESVAATSLADPDSWLGVSSSTAASRRADDLVTSGAVTTAAQPGTARKERASQLFDRTEHEERVTAATWQPIPVPPPTYTLKARAPEQEPEPAPDAVSAPAPVMPPVDPSKPIPIDIDDDLEWAHAHKVVNG